EAHFTIDADRRKCWARKGTTPIVYMNSSKEAINVGGTLTGHGKFHYQEMSHQIKEEVLKFVKRMHKRYKKVLFIFDRVTWHKNNLVMGYFKENKDTIDYMFLPTGAGARHVKRKRLILPMIL
ncbi:MAG: transposase, partial [Methanophagales archaeon]|nr:transposase [Methanophagales archaeon]